MKVALLELTPEMFIEFCKVAKDGLPRRLTVLENALPDDAEVVGVYAKSDPFRLHHGTVLLQIKSESFRDVPEGGRMPELPPITFQAIYDDSPIQTATVTA